MLVFWVLVLNTDSSRLLRRLSFADALSTNDDGTVLTDLFWYSAQAKMQFLHQVWPGQHIGRCWAFNANLPSLTSKSSGGPNSFFGLKNFASTLHPILVEQGHDTCQRTRTGGKSSMPGFVIFMHRYPIHSHQLISTRSSVTISVKNSAGGTHSKCSSSYHGLGPVRELKPGGSRYELEEQNWWSTPDGRPRWVMNQLLPLGKMPVPETNT